MTIVAEKAMIDDYEKKYGPLALSDPSCGRRTQGSFHSIFQVDTLNSNFPIGLIKILKRLQEIKSIKKCLLNEIGCINLIIFGIREFLMERFLSLLFSFLIDGPIRVDSGNHVSHFGKISNAQF